MQLKLIISYEFLLFPKNLYYKCLMLSQNQSKHLHLPYKSHCQVHPIDTPSCFIWDY